MPRAHPFFAATYSAVAAVGERIGYGRFRTETLSGAEGRLLIVGLGPGRDLDHLPPGVTSVIAVEPDASMRRRCATRLTAAGVPVHVVAAAAEALPLPADSVDAVLVALVLCSVQDPQRAAVEIRRVLRAPGTLHVLEHVHAPAGTRLAHWQDRIDPIWTRLAGGCHVNRDTRQVLADAGFETAGLHDRLVRVAPPPVASHLIGTVHQPASLRSRG